MAAPACGPRVMRRHPGLVCVLLALSAAADGTNHTPTNSTPPRFEQKLRIRGGAAGTPQGMLRSLGSLLAQGRASWRASWRAAAAEADDAVMEDVYGAGRGGSGAINEKTVVGASKAADLAPLLHASFGLDHYPNYLQRWWVLCARAKRRARSRPMLQSRCENATAAARRCAVGQGLTNRCGAGTCRPSTSSSSASKTS